MDLTGLSVTFGVMAGVIQLIGYFVYLKLSKGKANTGSWLIWTLSAVVDLISYSYVTGGDIVKEILPAACALACVLTFSYLLIKGRFGKPDKADWFMIGADTAISIAWWQQIMNAIAANLMLQVSTVASAFPMVRGILKGKEKESLAPWVIWTTAYACHIVSVSTSLDRWEELAYPVANGFMNVAVIMAILYKLRSSRI